MNMLIGYRATKNLLGFPCIDPVLSYIEIKVGARCASDLMDHILQKNSTDVVLGGFEPNQSYLVTALNLWTVGRIHTRSGFYSIKEVSIGSAFFWV